MKRMLVLLILISIASLSAVWAGTPDASAFEPASFTGITVLPTETGNNVDYYVELSAAPTMTWEGKTYDVVWLGGFYLLGVGGKSISASKGTTTTPWGWGEKKNEVYGYSATGNGERMFTNQSGTFGFKNVQSPDDVVIGYHIGYIDNGVVCTKSFISEETPEPGSLAPLAGMIASMGVFAYRRRKG